MNIKLKKPNKSNEKKSKHYISLRFIGGFKKMAVGPPAGETLSLPALGYYRGHL